MSDEQSEASPTSRVDETRTRLDAATKKIESKLKHTRRIDQRFMAARVVAFILIVAGYFLTAFSEDTRYSWFMMVPAIIGFILIVRIHRPKRQLLARHMRLANILATKTKRLASEERPEAAPSFLANCQQLQLTKPEYEHQELAQYVLDDLGVFNGRSNLFGLLSTAHTKLGSFQIANWLRQPPIDSTEISERQEAARELFEARAFREETEQEFARIGLSLRGDDLSTLLNDSFSMPAEEHKVENWIGTAITLALFASAFIFSSTLCFILTFAAAAILNYRNQLSTELVPRYREFMDGIKPTLQAVRTVEASLEMLGPKCSHLRSIHTRLKTATEHDELSVGEIEKRLRLLGIYKFGLFYVVFSWLTLFDLHVLPRVLRGFRNNRKVFIDAFSALGELEALFSFTMLIEEQHGWNWPIIDQTKSTIDITSGAHPFLPIEEARSNSLNLNEAQGVLVITGSNMSGKSTFLKMCGLNQLMAQCGGPVRAESMTTSPHLIHTDINVSDSLDDGRSYFAVEVGRIKDVIDDLENEVPTFSLLDEMFRGTNTNEKVAAGIEVTRWIASRDGKALVATHDAPFTKLEEDSGLGIRNFHFTEEIRDGKMVFDYRLRAGKAKSSNAIRVLGIEGYPEELVRNALENSRKHD
ncbi:MAG: hypothetical protein ACI97A_003613 [Planctomycetota bacterium]|jgi:hypothetical protein